MQEHSYWSTRLSIRRSPSMFPYCLLPPINRCSKLSQQSAGRPVGVVRKPTRRVGGSQHPEDVTKCWCAAVSQWCMAADFKDGRGSCLRHLQRKKEQRRHEAACLAELTAEGVAAAGVEQGAQDDALAPARKRSRKARKITGRTPHSEDPNLWWCACETQWCPREAFGDRWKSCTPHLALKASRKNARKAQMRTAVAVMEQRDAIDRGELFPHGDSG